MKQLPKNILNISLLLLLILSFGYVLNPSTSEIVRAGVGDNISGWAWGGEDLDPLVDSDGDGLTDNDLDGGIGWISFNCTDTSSCVTQNYGVTINAGNFEGYAWSSNLGWINFAPVGPYPAVGPQESAKLNTTNGNATCWGSNTYGQSNGYSGGNAAF